MSTRGDHRALFFNETINKPTQDNPSLRISVVKSNIAQTLSLLLFFAASVKKKKLDFTSLSLCGSSFTSLAERCCALKGQQGGEGMERVADAGFFGEQRT